MTDRRPTRCHAFHYHIIMVFITIMTLMIIINILIIIHIIIIIIICTTIIIILMTSSRTGSGEGPIDRNSPSEPKGEAGEGWLYNGGGKEDSHAGQDDNGSEVLNSLVGLLFFTSFSIFTPKLRNTTFQW